MCLQCAFYASTPSNLWFACGSLVFAHERCCSFPWLRYSCQPAKQCWPEWHLLDSVWSPSRKWCACKKSSEQFWRVLYKDLKPKFAKQLSNSNRLKKKFNLARYTLPAAPRNRSKKDMKSASTSLQSPDSGKGMRQQFSRIHWST